MNEATTQFCQERSDRKKPPSPEPCAAIKLRKRKCPTPSLDKDSFYSKQFNSSQALKDEVT